ncbi:TRAP-type C4-dicarboxylate transport system substrate-binding protein [Natronocella acetinitrilica]|uniref:TRAP-type C4-dicarboxylate transport system substrate-binding protein n=1 Tax=Natronocella acetinitrilica TaxID=414046 RepID=A0AAE3GAY1_9GAMM|nr:TRAP transporter substrate-binding protein DctP [Natronocella acetinitrilica]MCP1676932.1 TRAP-type C4-dicarboxylate transport system substrate-binding protein [Natronocella acetinitrilica]
MKKTQLCAFGLAILVASGTALAEQRITAVHAFPTSLIYTQSFLEFVDKLNERGEGVIQIDVRGGPEAIGLSEQPDAVRDGVVDMAYTAASFYAGSLPERDAMISSNANAIHARETGGLDLMNEIHQEKMGVYYLGWFDSGVSYNLYTRNEPSLDSDGNLDVSGLRLRSNPVYDAFFTDFLGARITSIDTTEVYSALERGVVDATGWTQIGLKNLGWDEFLNYRIEPSFYSTDMGAIINLDSWNALSEEAQQILQEVAIEHERSSAERFRDVAREQMAELEEDGMTVVELEGEAAERYLEGAREASWARMRSQMERHSMGLTHYEDLIEKFNDL